MLDTRADAIKTFLQIILLLLLLLAVSIVLAAQTIT